jgi:hypothetical protein
MTLESAQLYLFRSGGPVLMLIGTISGTLNLFVFTQKNLRKNPCSVYLIAYNIANLIYIYSSLFSLTLLIGYNIDPTAYNLVLCRLRLYTIILFNLLSPFYLILASIDRILVTSRNALTRQRSTRRFAYLCLIVGTLFCALFHSHALMFTNIIQLGPNYFFCYFQSGVYLTFVSYYSVIKEILAISSMIICGLWSIGNIRGTHRVRAAPNESVNAPNIEGSWHSTSSKDRQLVLMLITDVSIYALFSFVYASFLIYQQITQNNVKSPNRIEIESIVRNICLFIICIPFCVSCYANLLVSKTFRNEVKKVLLWR